MKDNMYQVNHLKALIVSEAQLIQIEGHHLDFQLIAMKRSVIKNVIGIIFLIFFIC